jgi:tRNA modification GTPase
VTDGDPIVAIATAPGRGAIGIVRLSAPPGAGLAAYAEALLGAPLAPRRPALRTLRDAAGAPLDGVLATRFESPASATGEDVLELHGHGGRVVPALVVARCLELAAERDPATGRARLPALRHAGPGEFTLRAFLNDKLDLAQAEAVADLVDAGTEAAARSAARSLGGAFSQAVDALAATFLDLRVAVESALDFADEAVEIVEEARLVERLREAVAALDGALATARRGALLRDGLRVVLVGQPNAGKSSLLNALAGAELAIVTPIAGTTRDRIEGQIAIDGVPVHVTDTAGLRAPGDALDAVERIGIERTWQSVADADAIVHLRDLARRDDPAVAAADRAIADALAAAAPDRPPIEVHNKRDAVPAAAVAALPASALAVSAVTGEGLDALRGALAARAAEAVAGTGLAAARGRHVEALRRARAHAVAAAEQAGFGDAALELVAEELRLAHDALGTVTGRTLPDDLLGAVFARFCIGK